ncbi:MAG TPA: hypothetical protein VMT58_00380, partial [Candidatus Binataceae bacterium]|nr:hypothetical protein [Candidatus Binataceae bacterium]
RILIDGWHVARNTEHVRKLYVTALPGMSGIGRTIADLFGIPPVCRLIPNDGERDFAGFLFLIAGIANGITTAALIYCTAFMQIVGILFFGTAGLAITTLLRNAARRFTRTRLEKLSSSDPRPPILFLRSFKDDQVQLQWGGRGQLRHLAAAAEPSPTVDHVLLEEATPVGPVIAIGMPGSPPPFGVERIYVEDGEWQSTVARVAASAQAIVIVVDLTPGVTWELNYLRDSGSSSKSLYLLPPRLIFSAGAIRRALSPQTYGHDEVRESVSTEEYDRPCIGWYQTLENNIILLTSERPTKASYVCALRLFLCHFADTKLRHPLTR